MKKGWFRQSARHSLAARGLKTSNLKRHFNQISPFKSNRRRYDYGDIDDPNLTRDEWEELKTLISLMEISDCYGTRDVTRRDVLERKASEEELKYAWLATGLSSDEFEEVYS